MSLIIDELVNGTIIHISIEELVNGTIIHISIEELVNGTIIHISIEELVNGTIIHIFYSGQSVHVYLTDAFNQGNWFQPRYLNHS